MSNGWESYEKLVLDKLVTLGEDLHRVEDKVETLLIDVAMLKIKAGAWGAVAGMIPAALAIVIAVVMN